MVVLVSASMLKPHMHVWADLSLADGPHAMVMAPAEVTTGADEPNGTTASVPCQSGVCGSKPMVQITVELSAAFLEFGADSLQGQSTRPSHDPPIST